MRHYTIKSLLRQLPNPLLERYFGGHGVLSEIDFSSLKRKRVATLFDAWNQLPEAQRSQLDAELRAIFDQSCEKGFKAIIDAAADQLSGDDLSDFVAGLSTHPNHYQRTIKPTHLSLPCGIRIRHPSRTTNEGAKNRRLTSWSAFERRRGGYGAWVRWC